jgi:hypothetical protein
MNPKINVRDLPSPQLWGSVQPGMSWHHIIPFSVLREVWNRLVDQRISTQLHEARVAIRQYLMLSDPNMANIDGLIDRMRSENTEQGAENTYQRRASASGQQLRPLEVNETNQLKTAATWQAWNVVEGPTARADDPGDYYLDRFTAGLSAGEATRMRAIEQLFRGFQSFRCWGPAPSATALRLLSDSVSMARALVRCDLPIRYRTDMWVKDNAGAWRKRRDGFSPQPRRPS